MTYQPYNPGTFGFALNLPPSDSAVSLLSNPMSSMDDFSSLSMNVSDVTLDTAFRQGRRDVEERRGRKENIQKHGKTRAKHSRQAPCNFRWQNSVSRDWLPSAAARMMNGSEAPSFQRPNHSRNAGKSEWGLSMPLRKSSIPDFVQSTSNARGYARKQQLREGPSKMPQRRLSSLCVGEFLKQPMVFTAINETVSAIPPGTRNAVDNDDFALPLTRFIRQESAASSTMPNMPTRKESLMSFVTTSSSSK